MGTRPQAVRLGENVKSRNAPMNVHDGKTFDPTPGPFLGRASGATRNKVSNFGIDHYLTFMGHERVQTTQSRSSQGNYQAPHRHFNNNNNNRDKRDLLDRGSKQTILPAQLSKLKGNFPGPPERRAPSRNVLPTQSNTKTGLRDHVQELHKKMHIHPHRPSRKVAATFLQPSYSLVNK